MPVVTPLPTNAVVQVTFRSLVYEQRIMNQFYYQFLGVPDPGIDNQVYINGLLDTLTAPGDLKDLYLDIIPNNQLVQVLRAQCVFPQRQRYVDRTIGAFGAALCGNTDTPNIAYSIKRTSTTPGPRGVGRIQVVAGTLIRDAGKVNPAVGATARDLFIAQMLAQQVDAVNTATWDPVLYSVFNGITNVAPLIGGVTEDTLRVMRRRTVRLGE